MVIDAAEYYGRRGKPRSKTAEEKKAEREARKEAERRETERRKLAEHARRVEASRKVQETRRVIGRKRQAQPEPERPDSQRMAWWCRPEVARMISDKLREIEARPKPACCPYCGGTYIRRQGTYKDDASIFVCPTDYGKTILSTGCGGRWVWAPGAENRLLVTPGEANVSRATDEPSWLAERPDIDWGQE